MNGRKWLGLIASLVALAVGAAIAWAQQSQPTPEPKAVPPKSKPAGTTAPAASFDHYLLALSWSPSYCADTENSRRDPLQCGLNRRYAFIVHGLWLQNESTEPPRCEGRASRVPDRLRQSMLDIMPSEGLIQHQWNKHGACSGMTQEVFFAETRAARGGIRIPKLFEDIEAPITMSTDSIEAAFIAVNPGLRGDQLMLTCRGRRLGEVRVCLNKDKTFRSCPALDRRGCRAAEISIPPVR
jgi:ribonuclease T2